VTKLYGFLQLRRGLWEHVRNGSLTRTGALVYIYMLTQADPYRRLEGISSVHRKRPEHSQKHREIRFAWTGR
jgi:hypothetical protein